MLSQLLYMKLWFPDFMADQNFFDRREKNPRSVCPDVKVIITSRLNCRTGSIKERHLEILGLNANST